MMTLIAWRILPNKRITGTTEKGCQILTAPITTSEEQKNGDYIAASKHATYLLKRKVTA